MGEETLTDDERADLARSVPAYNERAKALRIIDAANARIAELETQLRYRCPALVAERDAANARADEAEREEAKANLVAEAQLRAIGAVGPQTTVIDRFGKGTAGGHEKG